MANATWDIAQLERHLPDGDTCPDGAVYTAHWTASLEEDGESASAYGSVGFSDPDPATFVPFSELTKEEVLSWVFEALGVDQVTSIQEALYQSDPTKDQPNFRSWRALVIFVILFEVICSLWLAQRLS
jgi:hypothetical protein